MFGAQSLFYSTTASTYETQQLAVNRKDEAFSHYEFSKYGRKHDKPSGAIIVCESSLIFIQWPGTKHCHQTYGIVLIFHQ